MWFLLSTRVRTWLLLTLAIPAARAGLHYAAQRANLNDPDAGYAKAATFADRHASRATSRLATSGKAGWATRPRRSSTPHF